MPDNPQIKVYVDQANAQWDAAGESVDTLVKSLTGLSADVTFLKDSLTKIDNNPGPISAEDQALLTAGIARGEAAVKNLQTAVATAKALDEATEKPIVDPPTEPPTEPPTVENSGRR